MTGLIGCSGKTFATSGAMWVASLMQSSFLSNDHNKSFGTISLVFCALFNVFLNKRSWDTGVDFGSSIFSLRPRMEWEKMEKTLKKSSRVILTYFNIRHTEDLEAATDVRCRSCQSTEGWEQSGSIFVETCLSISSFGFLRIPLFPLSKKCVVCTSRAEKKERLVSWGASTFGACAKSSANRMLWCLLSFTRRCLQTVS